LAVKAAKPTGESTGIIDITAALYRPPAGVRTGRPCRGCDSGNRLVLRGDHLSRAPDRKYVQRNRRGTSPARLALEPHDGDRAKDSGRSRAVCQR